MNRYKLNILSGDTLYEKIIEANSHLIKHDMIMFFERMYHNKEQEDMVQPMACYPVNRTAIVSVEYDVKPNEEPMSEHNDYMSWKNVFNTRLRVTGWGDITEAAKAAHDSGYNYFDWNDRVFQTNCSDTFIKTKDLR